MNLFDLIKAKPLAALIMPTAIGCVTFAGNLAIALSDGQLDSNELHQLLSSASGAQTAILAIVMVALKYKGK